TYATIIAAIKYAADVGADVINLSFGDYLAKGGRENAQLMAALNRAVNYAHKKGSLLVASAGNADIDWDHVRYVTVCNDNSVFSYDATCVDHKGVKAGYDNPMKLPAQLPHVVAVTATGPQ